MTVFELGMALLLLPDDVKGMPVVIDDGHELCQLLVPGAVCRDQDLIQGGNVQDKRDAVFVLGRGA